jgi:cupin superfamily acireductone dioxygenase involved in methionine salvage
VSNWQSLIQSIAPKECGCGLVYELPHPLNRIDESFAIADMRNLKFSEPHYHCETEIYIILQGEGLMVVGEKEQFVKKDSVIMIPSNIAHFMIPKKDLVLAVINIPAFNPVNYMPLTEENLAVKFNKAQFDRLIQNK